MSWRRSWVVVRHDVRILRRDPALLILFMTMPIFVMVFTKPAYRSALVAGDAPTLNGAEQAVPGMAVTFSSFLVGAVGIGVVREHGWNTWERLRASWTRPAEIMVGKAVVPFATMLVHLAVLFGLGGLVVGLRVRGSYVGLALVAVALAACLLSLGFTLLALCRTLVQLNAASYLATFASALGGAFIPIGAMPGWARVIAPLTPGYWAMRGFRSVILGNGGLGSVALPVSVLLAFAAGFAAIALSRFRFEETKVGW